MRRRVLAGVLVPIVMAAFGYEAAAQRGEAGEAVASSPRC